MKMPAPVHRQVDEHPYPLVFATLSGAHLYGFPSPDSDYDIRGTHVLPLVDVVGLRETKETVDRMQVIDGLEIDIVTHDFKMFCDLLLRKKNGNTLEQIYSPLVLSTSAEHQELKAIASGCITKNHVHHYAGFAQSKWKQTAQSDRMKPKSLLYVFRVLLTGIHLMRSGRVEANILKLNEDTKLSFINDLVAQKTAGPEKGTIDDSGREFFEQEYNRLSAVLHEASEQTSLPENPQAIDALNDLLVRVRLKSFDTRIA